MSRNPDTGPGPTRSRDPCRRSPFQSSVHTTRGGGTSPRCKKALVLCKYFRTAPQVPHAYLYPTSLHLPQQLPIFLATPKSIEILPISPGPYLTVELSWMYSQKRPSHAAQHCRPWASSPFPSPLLSPHPPGFHAQVSSRCLHVWGLHLGVPDSKLRAGRDSSSLVSSAPGAGLAHNLHARTLKSLSTSLYCEPCKQRKGNVPERWV